MFQVPFKDLASMGMTSITTGVGIGIGSRRVKGTEAEDMTRFLRQFVDQLQACVVEGCGVYLHRLVTRRHRRLSKRLCPFKQPVYPLEEEQQHATTAVGATPFPDAKELLGEVLISRCPPRGCCEGSKLFW